jgi:hypothetical protein
VLEAGTDRPLISGPRHSAHDIGPGPPQTGNVLYFPLATNTALRGTPTGLYFEGFPPNRMNYWVSVGIEPDGRFRMVVPPGPGVLLVQSIPGLPGGALYGAGEFPESDGVHRMFPYSTLATRARDDGAPEGDPRSLPGLTGPILLGDGRVYHAYRVINPPPDARALDLTLNVPRAPSRTLRFVDPDGRAIRGVRVRGLVPMEGIQVLLDGSEVEMLGLEPGKPRRLIVSSTDGKYATNTVVGTDDPQPKTIRLEPAGSVIGRFVNENGKPLKGLRLNAGSADVAVIPPNSYSDAQGRFRIAPLFPGQPYDADIRGGEGGAETLGKLFDNLVLRAGEVRDLGDVRIKPSAAANSGTKPEK